MIKTMGWLLAVRRVAVGVVVCVSALLPGCGGGGGGSTPVGAATGIAITGQVAKGLVGGASVRVYRVTPSGAKSLVTTSATTASGDFQLELAPGSSGLFVFEAQGGTYVDEATHSIKSLGAPLRALVALGGGSQVVLLTPLSEMAVRDVEGSTSGWTEAAALSANSNVSRFVGAKSIVSAHFYDLTAPQDYSRMSKDDFLTSLHTAAMSHLSSRIVLPASTQGSVSDAIDAARRLASTDPFDDVYGPRWVNSIAAAIDASSLDTASKTLFKSSVLLLQTYAGSMEQIASAVPSESAGGQASVKPSNDVWEMVYSPYLSYTPPLSTLFNGRGALVAYGGANSNGQVLANYSASTGELYADSFATIGRWHGGVLLDANRSGTDLTAIPNSRLVVPRGEGRHYALAKPPGPAPKCGIQQLSIAASTKPTLNGYGTLSSSPVPSMIAGFLPDSKAALYYANGRPIVAFDIGVTRADSTTDRVTTIGGTSASWMSEVYAESDNRFSFNDRLYVSGMVTGPASNELVLLVTDVVSGPRTQFAVVFAPTGPVDTSVCAPVVRSPGVSITPVPASGDYDVFMGFQYSYSYRGAPIPVTFGPRGEFQSSIGLTLQSGAGISELAGDAYGQIGIIEGGVTLSGATQKIATPYAVANPNAVVPTTGTRTYVLARPTSLIVVSQGLAAGTDAQLPDGTIKSISIAINFNEYPLGTVSPYYGTASCTAEFVVGGKTYTVYSQDRTFQGDPAWQGPCSGAIVGPAADRAVVWFNSGISKLTVYGAALLRQQ